MKIASTATQEKVRKWRIKHCNLSAKSSKSSVVIFSGKSSKSISFKIRRWREKVSIWRVTMMKTYGKSHSTCDQGCMTAIGILVFESCLLQRLVSFDARFYVGSTMIHQLFEREAKRTYKAVHHGELSMWCKRREQHFWVCIVPSFVDLQRNQRYGQQDLRTFYQVDDGVLCTFSR